MDDLATPYGQKTRDSFWLSDFFLGIGPEYPSLEDQIDRIVRLLFGDRYITPRKNEVAMIHAAAAARRSASMARQVGAAIVRHDGTLIASGCNEVPSPGGGQYWERDGGNDQRDFQLGEDVSDDLRNRLLKDLLIRLRDQGWLSSDRSASISDDLTTAATSFRTEVLEQAMDSSVDPDSLSRTNPRSPVLGLIEYTRSVHAEMAAIMDAARHGVNIKDAHLYTTTYPCHDCTRHIIASGLASVTFVEPYPKSLASELSDYAITEASIPSEAVESESLKVYFAPFIGVAPSGYLQLFKALRRKDEFGQRLHPDLKYEMPRVEPADLDARFSIEKEAQAVEAFARTLHDAQLSWAD